MHLTLRQLEIFCTVAQTGSTTAAAAQIALSQSATSAALNALEAGLATRLFDRVGKRLLLNDQGRMLLGPARALLESAHEIEARFAVPGGGAGRLALRLAASTTIGNYLLPRLLSGFRAQFAEAQFDVHIGNTLDVVQAITAFRADIGLIEGPCQAPEVRVLPWREDELVIFAAPRHPLAVAARQARLTVRQLRQAQWLLRESGSGTREAVEHALLPHLHQFQTDMTLGSSEAIKNAVAEGTGVSCLSASVVADLVRARRLVVLDTTLPRLSRRLSLVHHRDKVLSPGLAAFVAHCMALDDAS